MSDSERVLLSGDEAVWPKANPNLGVSVAIDFLREQAAKAENVKIRVLSVSWKELARDIESAIEFDQSQPRADL